MRFPALRELKPMAVSALVVMAILAALLPIRGTIGPGMVHDAITAVAYVLIMVQSILFMPVLAAVAIVMTVLMLLVISVPIYIVTSIGTAATWAFRYAIKGIRR